MTRSFTNRVFRFAPSSNGYLHLGHAYSALLNFDMARSACGRFLLRIENIDIERCRSEFEQAIYEDLGWLGLAWETPVRRQFEHFSDYASALAQLSAQGLTYPCFCSRGEIMHAVAGRAGWPRDPDGSPLYPGTCKNLTREEKQRRIAAGRRAALRIDMEAAIAKAGRGLAWLEWALPRKHGRSGRRTLSLGRYDACSQGYTRKLSHRRRCRRCAARRRPMLLPAKIFSGDEPASLVAGSCSIFLLPFIHRHHALLRDASGQKLSKSSRAKSLQALRQEEFPHRGTRKSFIKSQSSPADRDKFCESCPAGAGLAPIPMAKAPVPSYSRMPP